MEQAPFATPKFSVAGLDSSFLNGLFKGLVPNETGVAVGVSGGPDSLLLMLLLGEYLRRQGQSLLALTVDHGLRPESKSEAAFVKNICAQNGISHQTLGPCDLPKECSQARARKARFQKLVLACHAHNMTHLCLAHHAGDQDETFLMRLAKGSGALGLSGMENTSVFKGLNLVRPFLPYSKYWILDLCDLLGLRPVSDPSNHNNRFQRVRTRGALENFPKAKQAIQRLQRPLQKQAAQHTRQAITFLRQHKNDLSPEGANLSKQAFTDLNPTTQIYALRLLLHIYGGQTKRTLTEAKLRNIRTLLETKSTCGQKHVCGGCVVTHTKNQIALRREGARCSPHTLTPTQKKGESLIWDDRFYIQLALPLDLQKAPLSLKIYDPKTTRPGLFNGERLIANFENREIFTQKRWLYHTTFPTPQKTPLPGAK